MKKEFKETNMELVNEENNVEEAATEKKSLWTKVKEKVVEHKDVVIKVTEVVVATVVICGIGYAIKLMADSYNETKDMTDDEIIDNITEMLKEEKETEIIEL